MGYVKMPEMLPPELVKALSGNIYTVKEESSLKDEMATTLKDFFKSEKKYRKKENSECAPNHRLIDNDICCPKKVKFIFLLNNAVVINVNAACEEDNYPR